MQSFIVLLSVISCLLTPVHPFTNTLINNNNNRFDTTIFSYGASRNRGGGGGGGGGWRGGGGRSFQRPSDNIPIRFSKTIKIDPEFKTPIADMNISEKTKKILTDKGFELMTPIQSQSYDLVYSGVDIVGTFFTTVYSYCIHIV